MRQITFQTQTFPPRNRGTLDTATRSMRLFGVTELQRLQTETTDAGLSGTARSIQLVSLCIGGLFSIGGLGVVLWLLNGMIH